MKPRGLLVLSLLLGGGLMVAQTPGGADKKETPPQPPLLALAPSNTQWTITYTPKVPEKEPVTPDEIRGRKLRLRYSPTVLTKRILKGGGHMVIFTAYEGGFKSEAWVSGGYIYETPLRVGEAIGVDARSSTDFPEVSWITAENFRGTVDVKGRKFHLYEMGKPPVSDPEPQAEPADRSSAKGAPHRAYIDPQSRLPIIVDAGPTTWTYQYSPLASTFPTPDPRIQTILTDAVLRK